ncbi:hypothetical protein CAC42_1256 [Sphaceloma murrayae]|uniref:Uncharacterized protein n=1 Tax=Sphaceloma murrayae TaxID=2082308 RepID=A0A2K1R2G9_9PEZI|nr:hypothetical protein CAC42_1256 [Sphaceloma murrayae]
MPSSADEAFGQEQEVPQRKDSLRQPTSKKQKKKQKKAAQAAKLIGEVDDVNTETDNSTPPIDLLAPPSFREEHLLSSSPEAGISETEPSCPETPPIFAQEIHDESDKVPSLESTPLEKEPPSQNGAPLDQQSGDPEAARQDDLLPSSPPRGLPTTALKFTPPSPSPLSRQAQVRSPPESPKPAVPSLPQSPPKSVPQSPRLAVSRPESRTMTFNPPRQLSVTDAPPPHMPQRHFSRIPDATFGLHDKSNVTGELPPGTDKYYCGFDSLDGASHEAHDTANNVLLIGSEGALDVCRYNRNRREIIGRLEGLRGSVIDAKILPVSGSDDPLAPYRPIVVCVLHGPAVEDAEPDGGVSLTGATAGTISNYQTTVDIVSLKRAKHLGTVYKSPLHPLAHPIGHPLFNEPKPDGSIVISAEGQHVVVASGHSGEVFVFAPFKPTAAEQTCAFHCIAKFWTRTREHNLNPQSEGTQPEGLAVDEQKRLIPILALSRRWLAIAPPSLSSSQKSIDGTPATAANGNVAPGVPAYVSPPPPTVDCEVDAPSGPGLLGRVTKQATNEIRKGAQWVGEQGMSMIKGYWNRSPSNGNSQTATSARKSPVEDVGPYFPPTHGHGREQPAVKIEPSLVSIIDLHKLMGFEAGVVKNPLSPLATFTLPDGCSFMSFAPNGLALLTSNQVGDSSTVWDLMRVTDARTAQSLTASASQIPHASGVVRKVVSFSRLSPSTVVDVKWTATSNRIGILTSKGTLHLHELPRNDLMSTAIRSPASPANIPRADLPSPSTSPQDLPSGWISGVRSGFQNVSGRLTAIRSASETGGGLVSSTRQSLNQASVAARYASGRAVRNSYNSALEGAYSLRHSQDNKIRLKSLHHAVTPGCFRWLSGKDEGLISTIADGTLCTYAVKSNYHVQGKRTMVVLDASRKAGPPQSLPPIAASRLPPAVLGWLNPDGPHASCAKAGIHGFWTLNRDPNSQSPPIQPTFTAGNVQQDKETCPQYLPLHRLKQVGLYTYKETGIKSTQRALGMGLGDEQWCFGGSLTPVEKVTVQESRMAHAYDVEERAFDGMIGQMEGEEFRLDVGMTSTATYGTTRFGKQEEDLI